MSTRVIRAGGMRTSSLVAAALLMLGVAGCRTAALADAGAPADAVAAIGDVRRLGERKLSEPADVDWVRTKSSYERSGLRRTPWIATAASDSKSDAGGRGGDDLAKAAQNPIANMISVPFQNNTNFGLGPEDRTQNVLNFQPVFPIPLGCGEWTLINRMIIPIMHQPDITSSSGSWDGVGDINLSCFVVPPVLGKWMVGVGPVINFPTAAPHLGKKEWAFGVSAVALTMPGKWVIGCLVSNIWSPSQSDRLGGAGESDVVNSFLMQPFINYNLPNKWYLVTAPIVTADWTAPSDNQWTVPVGGGIGKIVKFGKQPVNFQVQAFYNVATPDDGPEWQLRLQMMFLFLR